MHTLEPVVVYCVLIYFNPTPGFSGRYCRCLKFNKAFKVPAVMSCLRSDIISCGRVNLVSYKFSGIQVKASSCFHLSPLYLISRPIK